LKKKRTGGEKSEIKRKKGEREGKMIYENLAFSRPEAAGRGDHETGRGEGIWEPEEG